MYCWNEYSQPSVTAHGWSSHSGLTTLFIVTLASSLDSCPRSCTKNRPKGPDDGRSSCASVVKHLFSLVRLCCTARAQARRVAWYQRKISFINVQGVCVAVTRVLRLCWSIHTGVGCKRFRRCWGVHQLSLVNQHVMTIQKLCHNWSSDEVHSTHPARKASKHHQRRQQQTDWSRWQP
mgnify:CR=1 FL=1